jgi:hypothetical protein
VVLDPTTIALKGDEAICTHCRSFGRRLRERELVASGPIIERSRGCPCCRAAMTTIVVNGVRRCLACGIADLESEGHVAEFWWGEIPGGPQLNTGWGGSEIWACSCGARDEDGPGEPWGAAWARAHVETHGRASSR